MMITWARRIGAMLALMAAASALAEDINVAQVGPFTGLPSPDAHEVRDGARAYFERVNKDGGIRGRRITLQTLDDGFTGDGFATRFKEAMTKRPVALLTPIGSAALSKTLKEGLLDNADIVILNAIPGADAFRRPGHPKLFHVRAGDREQLERILVHCQSLGVARVHVLHQDLPIGEAGLAVVQAYAKAKGGITIESTVSKHAEDALGAAAKEVTARSPQAVIYIGTPKFMADGIAQTRKAGLNAWAFALSYLPVPLAVKVIGPEQARGVGISQTFPNPNGNRLPLQADFQATMAAAKIAGPVYSPFHLEGYISARVLVAALRRIEGEPTPTLLARSLRDMGELDLGGFRVNFSKSNIGSGWTDIGVISESGKLLY